MVLNHTDSNPSSGYTQSFCVKPKLLIIELAGSHDWQARLENLVNYDIDLSQLIQFFLENFRERNSALLNLEYSLMELCVENGIINHFQKYDLSVFVNEYRKLGVHLLNILESLGCFQNDVLDYCFADVLRKDTFLLWRPTNADV